MYQYADIYFVNTLDQLFAAPAPLPRVPVATGDLVTDVGNLIRFQVALAEAKRDEKLRALAGLVRSASTTSTGANAEMTRPIGPEALASGHIVIVIPREHLGPRTEKQ